MKNAWKRLAGAMQFEAFGGGEQVAVTGGSQS